MLGQTLRRGGVLSLYRGVTPTLLGIVPYAGISFFTYESLKKVHRDRWANVTFPTSSCFTYACGNEASTDLGTRPVNEASADLGMRLVLTWE